MFLIILNSDSTCIVISELLVTRCILCVQVYMQTKHWK